LHRAIPKGTTILVFNISEINYKDLLKLSLVKSIIIIARIFTNVDPSIIFISQVTVAYYV
ncbi:MAG: hypothetical protein QXQ71_03290, partial [Desulfurococcaceae archaeon]